jgi:hypothetical protein
MSNEVAKPGQPNPWEAYGNAAAARMIVGDLLKFSKGDYTAGAYDDEVPLGTKLVAVMDSLQVGWVRWQGNRPTQHIMGPVAGGFQPPSRRDLGDEDEDEWEADDKGERRDPWQFSNYLLLVKPDDHDAVFTFTTSSRGGLGALGELCKTFGKHMRQVPDAYPIVALGAGSYQHSNRSYGRIKYPVFEVVGWTDKGDFAELLDDVPDGSGNAAKLSPPPF